VIITVKNSRNKKEPHPGKSSPAKVRLKKIRRSKNSTLINSEPNSLLITVEFFSIRFFFRNALLQTNSASEVAQDHSRSKGKLLNFGYESMRQYLARASRDSLRRGRDPHMQRPTINTQKYVCRNLIMGQSYEPRRKLSPQILRLIFLRCGHIVGITLWWRPRGSAWQACLWEHRPTGSSSTPCAIKFSHTKNRSTVEELLKNIINLNEKLF
jgi:hypothetical protein